MAMDDVGAHGFVDGKWNALPIGIGENAVAAAGDLPRRKSFGKEPADRFAYSQFFTVAL